MIIVCVAVLSSVTLALILSIYALVQIKRHPDCDCRHACVLGAVVLCVLSAVILTSIRLGLYLAGQ